MTKILSSPGLRPPSGIATRHSKGFVGVRGRGLVRESSATGPQQKDNKMKIKQAKKMGRPRVYKHVMSTAERQQRWRDKVKADAQALLKLVKLY